VRDKQPGTALPRHGFLRSIEALLPAVGIARHTVINCADSGGGKPSTVAKIAEVLLARYKPTLVRVTR